MPDPKTYTEEELQAAIEERLAATKGEHDKAFQELWAEAKRAKERAKAFEGLDPGEARELKDKLAKLEQQKKAEKAGVTSEELDRLRAEVRKDLEGEFGQFRTRAEQLASENRALKLDNVVKAMMGKSGVRAERIDPLYRLTADLYDLTEDGKPMLRDRMGTPVEKFIAEDLSKQYPEFFQGSGSSGGGAPKTTAGGRGSPSVIESTNSPEFLANLEAIAKGSARVAG